MTDVSMVLVTAPDPDTAAGLARGLVEGGLAACVNVVPNVRSFYVWEGALEEATECQLLIKTRTALFEELVAWMTEHHPYDTPEVLALPIDDGSPAYLGWVRAQTKDG